MRCNVILFNENNYVAESLRSHGSEVTDSFISTKYSELNAKSSEKNKSLQFGLVINTWSSIT